MKFPKGLAHDFGQKFSFFHFFFLNKISPEKMFHDILDKKQAFTDYKNIDFR